MVRFGPTGLRGVALDLDYDALDLDYDSGPPHSQPSRRVHSRPLVRYTPINLAWVRQTLTGYGWTCAAPSLEDTSKNPPTAHKLRVPPLLQAVFFDSR
jgi:hypothetical protein